MMTDPQPALYIVKTGETLPELREQHGDFDGWIARGLTGHDLPVRVIDPRVDTDWPELSSVAGVVVTGSPAMVTDRAPWSERTAAWLTGLVREQVPILGICYGHQLLAHALGGEVGPHPQGIEIGSVGVERTQASQDDPLLADLPRQFLVQTLHEQSVLRLPQGAVLLASSNHEPHQAFRVGPCAWGVQFHPEFDRAVMHGYVELWGQRQATPSNPPTVMDTPEAATVLPRFARWAKEWLALRG